MAGFADVLLRGAILVLGSLALGGVAWTRLVLRTEPNTKPAPAAVLALRIVAAAAWLAALAQLATMIVALGQLGVAGRWPVAEFGHTTFARTALVRAVLGLLVGGLAVTLARRPAGAWPWHALTAGALGLVAASAVLSHAVARVEGRPALIVLDALHQIAAAVWIGGLAHLTAYAALRRREAPRVISGVDHGQVIGRFSNLALASVVTLVVAGLLLTWIYVGEATALVGTAYGVMILSKVVLLAAILGLAWSHVRAVRVARGAGSLRLLRFVEVELGLGVTVLFAAASLTSLPPAVDVTTDRATVAEVALRFNPSPPRLTSPPVHELIARAEPLMGAVTRREPVERAWSEYNHHWAGFFVLSMGLLAPPRAPRRAGGPPLAAAVARPGHLPVSPQRSAGLAAGARRLLGEPEPARCPAAPGVRRAHRGLRRLRVDGAQRPAGGASLGLRLPAAVRGRGWAAAHALPRDVQPQDRISRRGDARAHRHPRRLRRLGPLARAPPPRRQPTRRLALDHLLHHHRPPPPRV
jgi:putative copper export protein